MQPTLLKIVALATLIAVLLTRPIQAEINAITAESLETAVQQYQQSDEAAQRRWLQQVICHRAQPACQITMNAAQWNDARQRFDSLANAQQPVNEVELRKFLREVDREELAAIDVLARKFKFVAERSLRDDRNRFQLRLQDWRNVQARWQRAGSSWAQRPKLLVWLQDSIVQQSISGGPPLPAPPDFNAPLKPWPDDHSTVAGRGGVLERKTSIVSEERGFASVSQRIAGYNGAVEGVRNELTSRPLRKPGDFERITNHLAELAILQTDLYLDRSHFAADQQNSLPVIESLRPVLLLAQAKTRDARDLLESETVASSDKQEEDDIVSLKLILRQLKQMVPYLEQPVSRYYVP